MLINQGVFLGEFKFWKLFKTFSRRHLHKIYGLLHDSGQYHLYHTELHEVFMVKDFNISKVTAS